MRKSKAKKKDLKGVSLQEHLLKKKVNEEISD